MIRCSCAASRLTVIKHRSHLLFESGSGCPPGHREQPVTERSSRFLSPQRVSINTCVIWSRMLNVSKSWKWFENTSCDERFWWMTWTVSLCAGVRRRGWCGGFGGSEDRHGQLVALHAHRVFIVHRKPGSVPHRVTHGPRYMVRFAAADRTHCSMTGLSLTLPGGASGSAATWDVNKRENVIQTWTGTNSFWISAVHLFFRKW